MRRIPGIAVFMLVVMFATTTVSADIITSSLTGRVTAGEQPLAGVRVTATASDTPFARTATTNAEGRYFLDALPPGRYDVSFELANHQSLIRPVEVELGRVARTDAVLEPNEDEETVTSTAMTQSVVDTTAITSHFDRGELDRLPLWGGPLTAGDFAAEWLAAPVLDETVMIVPVLAHDAIDQVTVSRGILPPDSRASFGGVLALRTRSGGDAFTISFRDTYFDAPHSSGHFFEAASGGRVIEDRLWFFGSGWTGDHAIARDSDGLLIKASALPGVAHDLTLSFFDSDMPGQDASTAIIRYSGAAGDHLVGEAFTSRTTGSDGLDRNESIGRVSWTRGAHIVSGGASFSSFDGRPRGEDDAAFFLNDRWQWKGLTVSAGLRHENDEVSPRAVLAYDIRGNGRQALTAGYGEYADQWSDRIFEVTTVGFITAVGTGGTARIDAIRRDLDGQTLDQLQFESRYRLFDRFEFGAVYSHDDVELPDSEITRDIGRAWAGARFALGSHEVGFTLVERYAVDWATDLALRWTVPVSRLSLTLATDVLDLARDDGRSVRVWARVGL